VEQQGFHNVVYNFNEVLHPFQSLTPKIRRKVCEKKDFQSIFI